MTPSRRRASGSGRLRTLLLLGGLAGVGFGLGALAGGLWEGPDLVLSYVFGETQGVPWGEQAEPQLVEAPPTGPQRVEAPLAAPEETPPVAAPPPPGPVAGQLAVQVGAFSQSAAAEALAESLRAKGYPVYVSPGAQAGEARWRVRVGPIASRDEADRTADRLRREEQLPTWVQTEGG